MTRTLETLVAAARKNRHRLAVVGSSFLVVSLIVVTVDRLGRDFAAADRPVFEVGRVAEADLLTSKEILYVDPRATREKEEELEAYLAPVFAVDKAASARILSDFDVFAAALQDPPVPAARADLAAVLSPEELSFFVNRLGGVHVLPRFRDFLSQALDRGVFFLPDGIREKHSKGLIEVVEAGRVGGKREIVHLEAALTPARAKQELLEGISDLPYERRQAMALLSSLFVKANVFPDETATAAKKADLLRTVEPVFRVMPKGYPVVAKGRLVSEDDLAKINVFYAAEDASKAGNPVGQVLFLAVIGAAALMVFRQPFIERALKTNQVIIIGILDTVYFALVVVAARFAPFLQNLPLGLVLPNALLAMLVTVLVSPRAALLNMVVATLGQLVVIDVSPSSLVFSFVSGAAAGLVVRDAQRRIELAKAGVVVAAIQAGLLVVLGLLENRQPAALAPSAWWAMVNGFLCGILNLGFLPLLEHGFNVPTKFRLQELSDVNSPILKKMLGQAPGTYNHSVSVANLAETACREIGADALLARVGAYYHDIGKIDQSEYFVENQTHKNKHDQLKPSLSSTIIKAHVKIGIEQAKKLGLPEEVIDIISQHHGSGLIQVFYHRALENEDQAAIAREDYAYPGTPPASKEAAVVMLADSIEAAARSLRKASVQNLDKLVTSMVTEKINSGQLQEAELTLRDLEIIKRTFVRVLAGYYHSRIEYPKTKEAAE